MNIGTQEYTSDDLMVLKGWLTNPVFEKVMTNLLLQSVENEDLETQRHSDKASADYIRLKESLKRQVLADIVEEISFAVNKSPQDD